MNEEFRKQYPQYDDLSDKDLTAALARKGLLKANHDDLENGVNAETSHALQSKAPEVKPVVKGTKAEVLALKQAGKITPGNVIFVSGKGDAYIINAKAVQEIYGASPASSLKQAKKDLEAGGPIESILLGYPDRSKSEQPVSAAVDKQGNVITDLGEMADAVAKNNVLWAAEGEQDEVQGLAGRVATKWKEMGSANGDDGVDT